MEECKDASGSADLGQIPFTPQVWMQARQRTKRSQILPLDSGRNSTQGVSVVLTTATHAVPALLCNCRLWGCPVVRGCETLKDEVGEASKRRIFTL